MGGGLDGGGRIILLLARSLSLCLLALSAQPVNLIDHLPGQPPVGFKQYAGYINVNESAGTNFFYHFVEAAHPNASSLPLALWLNGGTGCSSIGGGAFTELGPFYPDGTGNGLRLNHHSWNKSANILFLESPAGVGWSYSSKALITVPCCRFLPNLCKQSLWVGGWFHINEQDLVYATVGASFDSI